MKSLQNISKFLSLMVLAAISGSLWSCSKGDDPTPAAVKIVVNTPVAKPDAGSSFVAVTAQGDWTIGFDKEVDWARLSEKSGTGNKSNLVLSWDKNIGKTSRTVTVIMKTGATSRSSIFTQKGTRDEYDIVEDPVAGWMELPQTSDSDLYFIHHPMTMKTGKVTRNYSYYWDPRNMVARWVAYPLNYALRAGSGRTNEWGVDPKLKDEYQPYLVNRSYSGYGQRGHQIPSADRKLEEANIETFYGVNMTPQNGVLNEGVWAGLEGYVRECGDQSDTLYVVTGCMGKKGVAYDNYGKPVAIPEYYFKALLVYKKNRIVGAKTAGYAGIGFTFTNDSYDDKNGRYYDSDYDYMQNSCTLAELEKKTGLNFFVNLTGVIGDKLTGDVKGTIESWWQDRKK